MNGSGILRTALGGLALCGMAGSALADDYIYKGDCERAKLVQQERTVDKLMYYQKYTGVMIMNKGVDTCGRDFILVYRLVSSERSTSKVVYTFKRDEILTNTKTGTCPDLALWSKAAYGTVTVTTKMAQTNNVCELYLWSDWVVRSSDAPSFVGDFSNRISPLSSGGLVINGHIPPAPGFSSPIAFTPVY